MSPGVKKIALVGQPNVGKSVIFGSLTGRYANVSNFPGTTVEVSRGNFKIGNDIFEVIDTPGLYSVYAVTEEEKVTLRILKDEDISLIVCVLDAKNVERMLPLAFQLRKSGMPILIVLNMFDEAVTLGQNIDTFCLSEKTQMPMVATVAITNQGMNQLRAKIAELTSSAVPANPPWDIPKFSEAAMKQWFDRSRLVCSQAVGRTEPAKKPSRLDVLLIHPVGGTLVMAAVLYFGLYGIVGRFGAGTVVDLFNELFDQKINPFLSKLTTDAIPWSSVQDLIIGEYGLATLGIKYSFGIILPIVAVFFLVFAVIEDSGYLPRMSFLLDRSFKKIGLSGKAVIPMILGLGCDTMAVMVTRTLPTRRERFIAVLLLSLCIPCSAQLGVILGLLGGSPVLLTAWLAIILLIFGVVGAAASRLLPGTRPSFAIEIPPMRVPRVKNVLLKTYSRMKWYFLEIVPLFLAASVIIWLFDLVGLFERLLAGMALPLKWMGLPSEASAAFVFGFFRRDYGAAGLYDINQRGLLTGKQLLVAVVVLTLFLPCITQFLIMIKEKGLKTAVLISVFVLSFAAMTGVALNWILTQAGLLF